MSTDSKSSKPMPSADEINAYLELSAARTKLRLPLAKGNALPVAASTAAAPAAPADKSAQRTLPLSGSKQLPTRREESSGAEAARPAGGGFPAAPAGEAWVPFDGDDER